MDPQLSACCVQEEIYSSSYAAAAYLEHINFPKDKKVYIVGEVGIQEELDLKGIKHCGGPADADKKIELKAGYALPHDDDVWSFLPHTPISFCRLGIAVIVLSTPEIASVEKPSALIEAERVFAWRKRA